VRVGRCSTRGCSCKTKSVSAPGGGATVPKGGTGFLYVNSSSLWWENGSVQVVATPASKPNPVDAPTPHLTLMANKPIFQVGPTERDASEVVELQMDSSGLATGARITASLRGRAAVRATEAIFISQPLQMDASILGLTCESMRTSTTTARSRSSRFRCRRFA